MLSIPRYLVILALAALVALGRPALVAVGRPVMAALGRPALVMADRLNGLAPADTPQLDDKADWGCRVPVLVGHLVLVGTPQLYGKLDLDRPGLAVAGRPALAVGQLILAARLGAARLALTVLE